MMTRRKRFTWFLIAILGTLLTSALLFLYVKTRDYDPSGYFEKVALLRQIKELDAHWELDAMKSKIGINKSYDPLVAPLPDLRSLRLQLDAIVGHQSSDGNRTQVNASTAFWRAFQQKNTLIEHFKSHNSVLRNSLVFLPTAAADAHERLRQEAGGNPRVVESVGDSVDRVLLATLVYEQAGSDDRAGEIETELGNLAAAIKKGGLPPHVNDYVDIFVAHVQTVLREHKVVNELLNRIAAVPTAARIDDINNLLNQVQQRDSVQAQRDRQYLLIFAAALIGLLLYAAARLIHSHAVINRVNTELQLANDTLEQRVQQRTSELRKAQAELVTAARQAGMAEIATNVLHNVGNVLNSVNVSAGVLSSHVRTSKAQGISKVVQLMNEHAGDLSDFMTRDQKGRMLPDYLQKLAEVVAAEQQSMIEELAQLTKSVDHIKDIVATQQSYAGASTVFEPVQLRDLIEDALRMSAGSLSRHQVNVVKEFAVVPALLLDKHRILQILINLIGNAKHAMDAVLDRQHQMTLRLGMAQDGAVRVQVSDNGEGIPPENLARIFEHGFTTRKSGHGFGLHSCVLAAQEMGGSLTVQSDGVGKGATFTLVLPIRTKAEEEENPHESATEPAHLADR